MGSGRFVCVPAALAALTLTTAAARADPYQIAVLQALDKVSARVSVLEVPVGKTVAFGNLEITARACDFTSSIDTRPPGPVPGTCPTSRPSSRA